MCYRYNRAAIADKRSLVANVLMWAADKGSRVCSIFERRCWGWVGGWVGGWVEGRWEGLY